MTEKRKIKKEVEQMLLIRFDWFIKMLLRNKADYFVLEGFLSALIKKEITIKSILESEGNQMSPRDKFNRVDLLVEDDSGEKIIVEIQNKSEFDYFQRTLFGTSKVITDNFEVSSPYKDLPKVISVSILFFDISLGLQDYLFYGTTEFRGVHTKEKLEAKNFMERSKNTTGIENPFPEYYFINVNKFDDVVKEDIDEWIYMLKNSEIKKEFKSKGIKTAGKKLDFEKLTKEEKRAYENYIKNVVIEKSSYDYAIYQGKAEGKAEERKETIIKMFKLLAGMGLEEDAIMQKLKESYPDDREIITACNLLEIKNLKSQKNSKTS